MSMSAEDLDAEACVKMATNTRNTNKLKGKSQQTKMRRQEEENVSVAGGSTACTGGSTGRR